MDKRLTPGRLLFVTQTHTLWGGMEWWVHHLTTQLTGRGWRVFGGLAGGAKYCDPNAYAAAHPHLEPVLMDASVGTESARRCAVRRAVKKVDPDVVIPVGIGAVFDVINEFDCAFVVPVLSMHAGWIANVLAYAADIDAIVPNSRLLEKVLREELGSAGPVNYVRQGVPDPQRQKSERGDKLRVGMVCRLEDTSKRVMDLVDVIRRVNQGVAFHVFGDGPDAAALASSIGPAATFHGYLSTAELYTKGYPELDAVLSFSPSEGSPNAIYEAMKYGVVPVSSRFIGSSEEGALIDGESALMFDVGDTQTAAANILRLASDRVLLQRLSSNAIAAAAPFSDSVMYQEWISIVESVRRHPRHGRRQAIHEGGRLERWGVSPVLADRLRSMLGRRYPHANGWSEWPGTQPADPEMITRVNATIKRLAVGDSINGRKR